jgi:DNA-binding transcriptional MerR regulator
MAIQQLDLFGNPIPASKQEEIKVTATNKTTSPKKEKSSPAPIVATKDNISNEQPTESGQNQVVYSDNQIRVKLKPKQEGEEAAKPAGKKRGRKKAAPRAVVAKSGKMRDGNAEDNRFGLVNIPDDETLNKKVYWGISEVAIMFGVSNSLIRFWTNEFAVLIPRKGEGSHRLYRPEDVKTMQVIYDLLRVRKFSIDGARKYLANNREQIDVQTEVMQSLTKFKTFLLEMKSNLGA